MSINKISGILISLLFSMQCISAQSSFTMEEAADYAYQNSPAVKTALLNIADSEAQIREILSMGLPQVNVDASFNHFLEKPIQIVPAQFFGGEPGEFVEVSFATKNNLNATASLRTMLFDGTFFLGLKAAREYKNFSIRQLEEEKDLVEYKVKTAFVNVLAVRENLEIIDSNIALLQVDLRENREIYEAGFIELLDVERIELTLSNLINRRTDLVGRIETAVNALKLQMGYPVDIPLDVVGSLVELGEEAVEFTTYLPDSLLYMQRSEYRTLLAAEELSRMDIKRWKVAYIPTLYGLANYTESLQREELFNSDGAGWVNSAVLGLELSIPIFDGFLKKAKIERAEIALDKVQIQKSLFQNSMDFEIKNAETQKETALRNLTQREDALKLAERIYQTTSIKYEEGVGTSFEVRQAEQDYYESQRLVLEALHDLVIAYISYKKALGIL